MLRSLSILLLACAMALPAPAARAWGRHGHAAVATLAEANLTPAARAQVQLLLVDDLDRLEQPSGRKTLAAVASWPDEIRDEAQKADRKAYKGWHSRANQVCSDELGACRDGHCVDQLIISFAAILGDRNQPARTRNEALKWVVHLVGDLHQPLHSGIDRNRGAAKVVMSGVALDPDATLHTVWDTELANVALRDWKATAALGETRPLPADAPTRWMIETREVALREVYQPLAGFTCAARLPQPLALDAAYQQRSVAVVRQQIERAGLRLAQLLNEQLLP